MNPQTDEIGARLAEVEAVRATCAQDADLARRVHAVKDYQHRRFQTTYADLLAQPRYRAAAQFFLDELYGPHDFTDRDAQFARIVPAMGRLFPRDIVGTVADLAELHALSETLDLAIARMLPAQAIDAAGYAQAWREVGRAQDRDRQIDLMFAIGLALDRYTANPLLRHSLRMMRQPARLAGLAALQHFLESGFDTFRALRGAHAFLGIIVERERALAHALFDPTKEIPADFHRAARASPTP